MACWLESGGSAEASRVSHDVVEVQTRRLSREPEGRGSVAPMRRLRCLVLGTAALLAASCAPLVASFDLGGNEPKTFALAVSGGEPQRAYDLLCPALRFGIPFAAFRDAVDADLLDYLDETGRL